MLLGCYQVASFALTQLNRLETACVLDSAWDRWQGHLPDRVEAWSEWTKATLHEHLEDAEFARWHDRGAAMDHRELVALMRSEVEELGWSLETPKLPVP